MNRSKIGTVAGGSTLFQASVSHDLEHLYMPFGFYWGGEFAAASEDGYSKLAFFVFSWCLPLVLLRFFSSFSSTIGTGNSKENGLVALGTTG